MSNIKKKILIVDDSELNRSLLADILSVDFDIIEAGDGDEAIRILHERELEISLMLLDIVMPKMDGFEVLAVMNRMGWIKTIPVIMISSETGSTYIDRAYDLGAVDYISRPFDERTVKHRVACNFMFSVRQKEMSELLSKQIYQHEKDKSLMIEILSHIVEFRNMESGLHVLHVNVITKALLNQLVKKTDKYNLNEKDINLIVNASALHDVGKITLPSEILNKPGKLTEEEYAIMKNHTVEGANMLTAIPFRKNEDLIKVGYQICRWHHERFDGRGYPDGLEADEIPISAQVVSIADVYDALTSERVYKRAYSQEEAVQMILNGECGKFNPILLECLVETAPKLKEELTVISLSGSVDNKINDTVKRILREGKTGASDRSIKLLERERQKFDFLSNISGEIVFEYSETPEEIKLSEWGASKLGLPVRLEDPKINSYWNNVFSKEDFNQFLNEIHNTSPENPVYTNRYLLHLNNQPKWSKVIARSMWSDEENPKFEGVIGKIVDVNDEVEAMEQLEHQAEHDGLTGLLNHAAAKRRIERILKERRKKYAFIVFDLDNFKYANDNYGHLFGDEVLKTVANRVKENIRVNDIAARMGGDEFIVFMEYKDTPLAQTDRIFKKLCRNYKDFPISVSMGVAITENFKGDYEELFHMADTAMYMTKQKSKRAYCFYDKNMKMVLRSADNLEDDDGGGKR